LEHSPIEHRRNRRRRAHATGHLVIAWRRDAPKRRIKYRLPDGTESKSTLELAWVVPDAQRPDGYRPKRGRPPEGWLSEDVAMRLLRDFLDQHTRSTPSERITFERCADAFIPGFRSS
jgi:hypothetical protein